MRSSKRLGWFALGCAVLFIALTIAVELRLTDGVDLTLTRLVQAVDWGPLTFWFSITDQSDGLRQVGLAGTVILVVFVLDRRLGIAALLCTASDVAWWVLDLLIRRPRPDGHLVHVVRHAPGGGYPSGHVVFYLWAVVLLALATAWKLPARLRFLPWLIAGIVLAVVCVGRIDFGEHWASDVAGGLLLGGGWMLAVIAATGWWRRLENPGSMTPGLPSSGPTGRTRRSGRPARGSQARQA